MDIFVRRRDKERLYLLECDLKTGRSGHCEVAFLGWRWGGDVRTTPIGLRGQCTLMNVTTLGSSSSLKANLRLRRSALGCSRLSRMLFACCATGCTSGPRAPSSLAFSLPPLSLARASGC